MKRKYFKYYITQQLNLLKPFACQPSVALLVYLRQVCQPSLRSAVFFIKAKIAKPHYTRFGFYRTELTQSPNLCKPSLPAYASLGCLLAALNLLKPFACQPSVALRVYLRQDCQPSLRSAVFLPH